MSWYRFFKAPMIDKAAFLDVTYFLVNENTLTKQLIPGYNGLCGPADDFNNITGEEFIFSEDFYFRSYTKAPDQAFRVMNESVLNDLVAVLYRKKKPGYDTRLNADGDPRQPFNQNICAYNSIAIISKWPFAAKLAVFTWYEACRQQMIEGNPDIFSGGEAEPAKYGLISVMRVIAEGGIHGTFENVQKMYVKMWMVELNEKADEIKRIDKAMKP